MYAVGLLYVFVARIVSTIPAILALSQTFQREQAFNYTPRPFHRLATARYRMDTLNGHGLN